MTDRDVLKRLRNVSSVPRIEFDLEGEPPPWEPVATAAQITKTEDALGFRLPESMKLIYSEVANGGFGPAYGLMGVTDDRYDAQADDAYIQAHYEQVRSWSDETEEWQWPEAVISIADIGCGMRWCLDCKRDELVYFAGDSIGEEDPDSFRKAFVSQGVGFEQAIMLWLDKTPWDKIRNT